MSRSSIPLKSSKKLRAPPSQSFSARPRHLSNSFSAATPYQRRPRSQGDDDALDRPPSREIRVNSTAGAGEAVAYRRLRPSTDDGESQAHVDAPADHFRLPTRRIVSASYPPSLPRGRKDKTLLPISGGAPAPHSQRRLTHARSQLEFRNNELEIARVTRRDVYSPPPLLAPLRALPGHVFYSASTDSKRDKTIRQPAQELTATTTPSSGQRRSPAQPSSFADLLAAAAAVEQEDATTIKTPSSHRAQPSNQCTMDVEEAGMSSSNIVAVSAFTPAPLSSSSLGRLLGAGQDAKVVEHTQSPMFL
ncbi:hypothetical protein JCM10908_005184 [Rhodotorula pacifica]|uniref:uncharacterized protein n=1 Tax=Rhodotorula pacifica TaxID=1495444 RepID=UPI00317DD5AC